MKVSIENPDSYRVSEKIWRDVAREVEDGEFYIQVDGGYMDATEFYADPDSAEIHEFHPAEMREVVEIDGMDAQEWIWAMCVFE